MGKMTPRQRVLIALDHQEPDRVPLDLLGNASMRKTYGRYPLCDLHISQGGIRVDFWSSSFLGFGDSHEKKLWLFRANSKGVGGN